MFLDKEPVWISGDIRVGVLSGQLTNFYVVNNPYPDPNKPDPSKPVQFFSGSNVPITRISSGYIPSYVHPEKLYYPVPTQREPTKEKHLDELQVREMIQDEIRKNNRESPSFVLFFTGMFIVGVLTLIGCRVLEGVNERVGRMEKVQMEGKK